MEDVEDLIMEWMILKANEYEDEDEYLLAMEGCIIGKSSTR